LQHTLRSPHWLRSPALVGFSSPTPVLESLFADPDVSQKTHVPLIGLRLHNGRMEIWEVNGSQQSDHQGTYLGCSLIPCYLTLPARKSFHTFGKMRRFTRREVLRLQMGDMYIEVSQVVSANTLSRTFRQPLPFDT